jgi:hypothetical protein
LALSGAVAFLLPGTRNRKERAVRIARWVPAMGFAYLLLGVVAFSVWSSARGRDWGWGDTWQTPVLGNYSLIMVDVTDQGTIFDRTDADVFSHGTVGNALGRRDVIFGVRRMEVRAPYLIGTAAPSALDDAAGAPETLFFILNTRTGIRTDEGSLAALQAEAEKLGGRLKLQSVKDIYSQFRYGKADLIPLLALAIPPVVGSWFLIRWFLRLRAEGGGWTGHFPASRSPLARSAGLFLCSVNGSSRSQARSYR